MIARQVRSLGPAAGIWPRRTLGTALPGGLGEDTGAVAGFEDACLTTRCTVMRSRTRSRRGFGGHVEVEVAFVGDVEGLEDAGYASRWASRKRACSICWLTTSSWRRRQWV
jgi:hypothetical protein